MLKGGRNADSIGPTLRSDPYIKRLLETNPNVTEIMLLNAMKNPQLFRPLLQTIGVDCSKLQKVAAQIPGLERMQPSSNVVGRISWAPQEELSVGFKNLGEIKSLDEVHRLTERRREKTQHGLDDRKISE